MITEKKENVGGGNEGVGEYGVGDLVRAQRGEIVFIQLPDHLPMPQPPAPKAAADASTAVKTPPAYCSLSRLQVLKIYVYHSAAGSDSCEKSQKCSFITGLSSQSTFFSTTVYVPSSELGLPHPLSRKRVCPPSSPTKGGHCGWGGWEVPIPTTGEKA